MIDSVLHFFLLSRFVRNTAARHRLIISATSVATALLGPLGTANVVDSEQQASALNSSLDALQLDGLGLPDAKLVHVDNLACIAVDAPCTAMLALGVLGPQLRQHSDGTVARVLDQRAGNHLHGLGNGLVGPLGHALDTLGQLGQTYRDGHLGCTTAGGEVGVEDDVSRHRHGVCEVTVNLVQNVLAGPAEQDRARLGVLAFGQEGEVLVADLADLEEAALGAHVGFLQFLRRVDNGGAGCAGDTVVVSLADTAEGCDACLHEEMLCEV